MLFWRITDDMKTPFREDSKRAGFILMTMLIFLQIFSLISLYGLTRAHVAMKKNNYFWKMSLQKLKAKMMLKQLEKRDLSLCMIPTTSVTTLTQKSRKWWERNACSEAGNGIYYYYAVESLAIDACGIMEKAQIAHYYRITLFVLFDKLGLFKYFIQSTIARPENKITDCHDQPHFIQNGRQMWREI
jgi:hypothetical protein